MTCQKKNPVSVEPNNDAEATDFIEPAPSGQEAVAIVNELISEYEGQIGQTTKEIIQQELNSPLKLNGMNLDKLKAQKACEMGIEAVLRGSFKTALYCFLLAIQYDSDNSEYFSKAGFVLNYLERYTEAKKLLLRAEELDNSYHATFACLSKTWQNLGDLNRAIYYMNRALALFSKNPHYLIAMGNLYYLIEQDTLAAICLQQAEELAPYMNEINELKSKLPEIYYGGEPGDSQEPPEYEPPPFADEKCWDLYISIFYLQFDITIINENEYNRIVDELKAALKQYEIDIFCDGGIPDEVCCQKAHTAAGKYLPIMKGCLLKQEQIYRKEYNEFTEKAFSMYYNYSNPENCMIAYDIIMSIIGNYEARIYALHELEKLETLRINTITNVICDYGITPSDSAKITQPSFSFSGCLLIICIGLTESTISLSGNLKFYHLKFEANWKTDVFGFGFGVGINKYATVALGFNTAGELKVYSSFKYNGVKFSGKKVLVDFW